MDWHHFVDLHGSLSKMTDLSFCTVGRLTLLVVIYNCLMRLARRFDSERDLLSVSMCQACD